MARDGKYMDNKWKVKFPKIYKEKLQMADIGGIGNITYKKVVYSNYEYALTDEGAIIRPTVSEPVINPQEDYDLTGEALLVELCNLARDINKYDVDNTLPAENKKSIRDAQRKGCVDSIIDWCKNNMHPYDIEDLFEKYHVEKKEEKTIIYNDGYDGTFKLSDFMKELSYVYAVFTAYYAFIDAINGNPTTAYNLYEEGIYFDTLDIFEKYKTTTTYDEYEEDPSWDIVKAMQEANKHEHTRQNSIDEFRKAIIKDKDEILTFLSAMIPDLKMCLIYKNSKAVFTANINSVFDICWYTLSRFIATNSGSPDLDLSIDTEDFRSTHIGVCRSCGRYMEMKSNRQLYCKRDDCQRDRNRRKQKDFQQRKRENAN